MICNRHQPHLFSQGQRSGHIALIVLCVFVLCYLGGCMLGLLTPEPTPPPAPPRPIPFVTEARYIQNLLANNECLITVKNEGAAGRVTVEVYTEIDRGGDHERGESGLERWKRETFTRKSEPEPVYRPQLERTRQGWTEFHMEAGEEKAVRLELKYYRMMDGLQGNRLQVDAKGYPPASL